MSNGSEAAGLAAVFAMLLIPFIIVLIVSLFLIFVEWMIFAKGKQPGWAALIPFYNEYIECKMVGVNPWWILIKYGATFILSAIPVLNLVAVAISIYYLVLVGVSLARSFGKEDSYAVGIILLPIVFLPILAFGSAQYKGATPMKDVVWEKAAEIFGKKNK